MRRQRRIDAVCFDCDSTLSRIEGIDELARRAGQQSEIAALTAAAMNGDVPLEEVYGKRLATVRPDQAGLAWLAERYREEIVSGAAETVETLRQHGRAVYIVTSGLQQAIEPFAVWLGFLPSEVYAVEVYFDEAGAYRSFDATSPLCCSDGKATICRRIAAIHGSVAMVGDGVTDLAARAGGAHIIGFGGVRRRDAVLDGADFYFDSPSLVSTLSVLLRGEDPGRFPD
jgi:phosphoserine phosphatase